MSDVLEKLRELSDGDCACLNKSFILEPAADYIEELEQSWRTWPHSLATGDGEIDVMIALQGIMDRAHEMGMIVPKNNKTIAEWFINRSGDRDA